LWLWSGIGNGGLIDRRVLFMELWLAGQRRLPVCVGLGIVGLGSIIGSIVSVSSGLSASANMHGRLAQANLSPKYPGLIRGTGCMWR
jgi:hypothetical protein